MSGVAYYRSPVGNLRITSDRDHITEVSFHAGDFGEAIPTPVIEQCMQELDEYFLQGRKFFDVPIQLSGTAFQQRVWNELLTLPFGQTISYLELAIRLGDINTSRAVGFANGQNPVAIIVPCHRVIGKNGDVVGYAGGIENKLWLLRHEGAFSEQLSLF